MIIVIIQEPFQTVTFEKERVGARNLSHQSSMRIVPLDIGWHR